MTAAAFIADHADRSQELTYVDIDTFLENF